MNKQRFDIIGCALLGMRSVFAERRYLLAAALMPVGVTALIELLKIYGIQDPSILSETLTMLPTGAAAAWFMFLQTRLLVFGERAEAVPPENILPRRRAFETSALLWLLLQMALLGMVAFMMYWARATQSGDVGSLVNVAGYLLLGASFWALRLGVVHILGAIGYSIREYIFQVNGIMVSVRLLGLMMCISFPLALLASPLSAALFGALQDIASVSPLQMAGLVSLNIILKYLLFALLNAAAVFALRQMLGQNGAQRGIPA